MRDDLFQPDTYAEVRRPALQASMLPPACYVNPRFHARERTHVFARTWSFIGDDGRIPAPGDYFTIQVAGTDLMVLRDNDGRVGCFANVCRHRGCRLVNGAGNTRLLRCPYHGWTYGLSGELRGAPQMMHSLGFDPAKNGLIPVRLERWGRLLFVNLDAGAGTLADYLGDLQETLGCYGLDHLVCTRRREIDIPCNWKVYYENLMEPYHTPYVHAGGLAEKNEDTGAEMLSGNSGALFGGGGEDAPVRIETGDNYAVLVTRHAGSRALLPGAEPFPAMDTLRGRATQGSQWVYIYPCTTISFQRECVWYNQIVPRGPDAMSLVMGSLFPPATTARHDFEARVEAYYERLDRTADEDLAIVVEQQAGLASPLARAGRVSHLEAICHAQRNWLLDRILCGA